MVEVEWMNNIQNNELLEVEVEETERSMQEFAKIIQKDIEHINSFTYKNIDELIGMIFDNCQDISEIEYYISTLKDMMVKDYETKERLKYQQGLTKKDIIVNNIYPIYGVYTATVVASALFTNDPISLLQNFILLTTIQVFAFKVNLDYFTSERYKKKIAKKVKELTDERVVDNYNVQALNKFRDMCVSELKIQIAKLYEIMQNSKNAQDVYNRISSFLQGMNIDFVLTDESALTRKRTLK